MKYCLKCSKLYDTEACETCGIHDDGTTAIRDPQSRYSWYLGLDKEDKVLSQALVAKRHDEFVSKSQDLTKKQEEFDKVDKVSSQSFRPRRCYRFPGPGEQWQDKEQITTRQNSSPTKNFTEFSAQAPVQKTFQRLCISSRTDADDEFKGDAHMYSELDDDQIMLEAKMEDVLFSITKYDEKEYDKETRIVLLGKTGSGKSATGNTLLGTPFFKSKTSSGSITKECCRGESEINGKKVIVVDTPGLFDTRISPNQITESIIRCFHMLVPGPHVFLIIIQIGRFTNEEINALNQLFNIIGDDMKECSILVFTHLDKLEKENSNIKAFIDESDQPLVEFINRCKDRYFAIDNTAVDEKKKEYAKQLLYLIDETVRQNGGKYYSNEILNIARLKITKAVQAVKQQSKEKVLAIEYEFNDRKKRVEEEIERFRHEKYVATQQKRQIRLLHGKMSNTGIDNNEIASKKEMQISKDLSQTDKQEINIDEISKRIENIRANKRQAKDKYEKLKQEKIRKVKEIEMKQKTTIINAIEKVTEDTCTKINLLQTEISEIDDEIEQIQKQKKDSHANKNRQKSFEEKEQKLIRQKEETIRKQDKLISKMIQNSNLLHRQLTEKHKMCTII